MLQHNFKYETKTLFRSRWIQFLSLILVLLLLFAGYNGKQKVVKRQADINAAYQEMQEADELMLKLLDSVQRGLTVSVPSWTVPTSPMSVGNYYPRVVAMEPTAAAFLATGQSDIFTHIVKPTSSGDDFTLNYTEMTSPVQLLFGSFDLSFVIIYLLPLLIIAFSYNVLSSEREQGSLPLLASQPVSIYQWVLQKIAIRFFWIVCIVTVALFIAFLVNGLTTGQSIKSFFPVWILTVVYMLFWFSLSFLINLRAGTSAKNAVTLLGFWVLFVLLVPSVLNQLSSTVYPMPSRTKLVNDMRTLKAEAAKEQDKILDSYLRDHPEYAIADTTQSRNFWHRFMASQLLVKKELTPTLERFEQQLKKQQKLTAQWQWTSPSIMIQQSFNEIAGTSTTAYEDFRKQVLDFATTWRAHFLPMLYNNRLFSTEKYPELPQFRYKAPSTVPILPTMLTIIGISALLILVGWLILKTSLKQNQVIIS